MQDGDGEEGEKGKLFWVGERDDRSTVLLIGLYPGISFGHSSRLVIFASLALATSHHQENAFFHAFYTSFSRHSPLCRAAE